MKSKEEIKSIIEEMIEVLNSGEFETFECFGEVYPEDMEDEWTDDCRSFDQALFTQAINYPELHGLMRQLVGKITEANNDVGELWDNEEEHAGANAARLLALSNKEDVILMAKYLASNDLNHEVYQDDDIHEVIAHWGLCRETFALIATRLLAPGQASYTADNYIEELSALVKDDVIANALLEMFAKFFIEEWSVYGNSVEKRLEVLQEYFAGVFADILDSEEKVADFTNHFGDIVDEGNIPTIAELREV